MTDISDISTTTSNVVPSGTFVHSKTLIVILKVKDGKTVKFNKGYVEGISDIAAQLIPEDFEIDLNSLMLAIHRHLSETNLLFGANFGVHINLSKLPLVGKVFPKDQTVGVDNFQLLLSTKNFTDVEIGNLKKVIPADMVLLPPTIDKGATITTLLEIGIDDVYLSFSTGGSS
ncbi:MAG: hypothetical protein GY869_28560, partial [Planctomycetes bacterium]|nr:hypothetical protein [Planctomycetota bacterium]